MSVVIVTGSAGLIGAEAVRFFDGVGLEVIGIDNDMRREFFGDEASTSWARREHEKSFPRYRHEDVDIRDRAALERIFRGVEDRVVAVVHTAAQPSHDWAARDPFTDFDVNATGTLNLLEMTRLYAQEAVFLFTSTNKVYGDTPNRLPLEMREKRFELPKSHPFGEHGIDETMSIDQTTHSLFGVSKTSADLLVQEYGRYFGLRSAIFRAGCLTGPGHSGAELHGFLAYLVQCAISDTPYTVFGYEGKQVRDNIHSGDLVSAFWHFIQNPRVGEVYNIGGSRHSNCSMLEAIEFAESLTGRPFKWTYKPENRVGDHIWWISDVRKFQSHYPEWRYNYDHERIMIGVYEGHLARRRGEGKRA